MQTASVPVPDHRRDHEAHLQAAQQGAEQTRTAAPVEAHHGEPEQALAERGADQPGEQGELDEEEAERGQAGVGRAVVDVRQEQPDEEQAGQPVDQQRDQPPPEARDRPRAALRQSETLAAVVLLAGEHRSRSGQPRAEVLAGQPGARSLVLRVAHAPRLGAPAACDEGRPHRLGRDGSVGCGVRRASGFARGRQDGVKNGAVARLLRAYDWGVSTVKRVVVGSPIDSSSSHHSLLSKRIALPVFCSDPLSSVAYATDQILLVLVLGGVTALTDAVGRPRRHRAAGDRGDVVPQDGLRLPGWGRGLRRREGPVGQTTARRRRARSSSTTSSPSRSRSPPASPTSPRRSRARRTTPSR